MNEPSIEPHLLTKLVDLAYVVMIVRDPTSRIIFWNRRSEEFYGWSRAEALGQTSHDLLKTGFPTSRAAVDAELERHGHWEGELIHTLRSGERVVVLSRQALHRNEQGVPVAILEVNLNITERKQAEAALAAANQALSQSEAALREQANLLNLTHDAIIVRDMDDAIQFWNRGAQERYGWTSAEALGQRLHSLLKTQFPVPASQIYAELLAQGHWEGELRHSTRGGRRITVLCRWSLQRDAEGRPAAVMETNNDITLRKQAEAQREAALAEVHELNRNLEQRVTERTASLSAALEQIAATNKELEAFSYSVSHDLRAPLRAIDGFSRILAQEYASQLEPDALEYLQLVRTSTQQMGDLIDDLLAFSRLGRQTLQRRPVDLTQVARQALDTLSAELDGRQLEVTVGRLPTWQADPTLLKQVFINLLSNALKFTRSQPLARVEIGSRQLDGKGEVAVFVRDNGVGFDMQYVDRVFGVFQRLHRAEEYEGTGVGLALVQRIIHRHGGRIWAESERNKGATFFFTLGGEEHG